MNAKTIGYWVTTGLVAFAAGTGGLAAVFHVPGVIDGQMKLGYPLHFVVLLGVWKTLGALTLLAPRFPLVKEWAYAGLFIDFTGAMVTAGAWGDWIHVVAPGVLVGMLVASWMLRPASRRLANVPAGA
jgi:hypothetical protein